MVALEEFGAATPPLAVIAICVSIAIIGAATWRNAKGEGWGLIVFLCAIILGFNLSVPSRSVGV